MNPERLRLERAVPAHPRFANRHVGNLPPMPDYPALVVRDGGDGRRMALRLR
jgi:hypothetical protein